MHAPHFLLHGGAWGRGVCRRRRPFLSTAGCLFYLAAPVVCARVFVISILRGPASFTGVTQRRTAGAQISARETAGSVAIKFDLVCGVFYRHSNRSGFTHDRQSEVPFRLMTVIRSGTFDPGPPRLFQLLWVYTDFSRHRLFSFFLSRYITRIDLLCILVRDGRRGPTG